MIVSKSSDLARISLQAQLTALRQDNGFHLMLRQTHSIHAHIPVGSQRSANPEEQEDEDGGEENNACRQSVHASGHLSGIHDAEKKEADGYFHEGESDKGLYPIGPAQDLKHPFLCSRQVKLVSSKSGQDLCCDESSADQGGHLVQIDRSVRVCLLSTRSQGVS